jgi:anti-sigma B factor antagonist
MNIVELNTSARTIVPHIMRLEGRLDANQVTKCKSSFIKEISDLNHPLVLNLSKITFIDSTGLGLLVAIQQAKGSNGEAFAICDLTDKTRLLLELTRLNMVFDIHEDESMAVEALSKSLPSTGNQRS